MRKFLFSLMMLLVVFYMFHAVALAQGTILPKAEGELTCTELLDGFDESGFVSDIARNKDQWLGCAITTGRVSLPMIPYFIQYFSNFLLGLVSLIALLFVVIGGFLYTMGGLTGQKEKGKTFITNALMGMVIAFLAWSIVNVILSALTG